MKNFFKNRTWDDYLIMAVMGIMGLGFFLFIIGFYFGFEPTIVVPGFDNVDNKISIHKITSGKFVAPVAIGLENGKNYDLFTLAGSIDSTFGALYSMVVVSLIGFSFIMLSLLIIIIVIIGSFTYDMVQRKKMKKQA